MRDAITTGIEIVGLALISVGAALTWPPLGLIAGGAALVGVGYLLGRDR